MTPPHSSGAPGTVVFDFDGVLIRRDSTVELLRRRIAARPTLAPLLVPGIVAFGTAGDREQVRTRAARRILGTAFAGVPAEQANRWLGRVGVDLGSDPALVVAPAADRLRAHQSAGSTVLVASAGLTPLIEGYLAACGVDGAHVFGSELADGPGGAVLAHHNFGAAKVDRATAAGHPPRWARVYSDSLSDLPLLCRTDEPVLVNASRRTSARARAALLRGALRVSWS